MKRIRPAARMRRACIQRPPMCSGVRSGAGSRSSVAGRPFPLVTLEEAPALNGLGAESSQAPRPLYPSPGRGACEDFSGRNRQGPAQRGHEPTRMAPALSFLTLAPAIGGEHAVESIVAEREAMRASLSRALAGSTR